ncbi:hypothetical protein GGU10DRAFT_187010 [Lentinula aff. detonsa]|uniref:Uncharacterized protein n=1 Tax=Lentinula aff. detonsa TaxID=2804958 RepID=A0AA38KPX5_9AGAR|nr:hypothetical protein GGU10DRAFT_187010 [Lentinula aff. detonsa]
MGFSVKGRQSLTAITGFPLLQLSFSSWISVLYIRNINQEQIEVSLSMSDSIPVPTFLLAVALFRLRWLRVWDSRGLSKKWNPGFG